MKSRALKINLADYRVDVTIDPKYHVIQDVMSRYYGLRDGLETYLKEVCHPYRNWQFIVKETRTYTLSYLYDLRKHDSGPEAARLYMEILLEAVREARQREIKEDAFKNLYLFLQKIITESEADLPRFMPALDFSFRQLSALPDDLMALISKNYYQINRLASAYLRTAPGDADFGSVTALTARYLGHTYDYWLSEDDPGLWFSREADIELSDHIVRVFEEVSHGRLEGCRSRLQALSSAEDTDRRPALAALLELPGFGEFVASYDRLPRLISELASDERLRNRYRLLFLFHIMNVSGLAIIHEEALREVNRTVTWIIENEEQEQIEQLILKTFGILDRTVDEYPDTVLMCVLNMGKGVYNTDNSDLVKFFNRHVVQLGFQTPDFTGITDEWQIQSNASHVQNIRTWMEITKLNPRWSAKLISSLIIHLSIYGVLIKDTDLFPRDITGFLNADIQPVYNLAKQLMRIFPAYFNEIGAEGQLRDISTKLDESMQRKDILIHFLRKQSHVESSNKIIPLIEAVLEFWRTKNRAPLEPYLADTVLDDIEESGPYIDGVHEVMSRFFEEKGIRDVQELLALDDDVITVLAGTPGEDRSPDTERASLLISFYRLLNQKYCISYCDIHDYVAQVRSSIPADLGDIPDVLAEPDTARRISGLLDVLLKLKAVILSKDTYEIREDIYRKRHIAAGIPSMYGSYHEAKFDALGLSFRLESVVNTLFEELTENLDLSFITHSTFFQIHDYLNLFRKALEVDGISTKELERQLDIFYKSLKIKLISFPQYLDIFRGFTHAVGNIVVDYFNNIHRENLREISDSLKAGKLLPKYSAGPANHDDLIHRVSEIFLRDTIATSLGLQRLDLFLARILNTLYKQAEKLPADKHYLLLTYNTRNIVTPISDATSKLADIVQVGNKALNLIKMNRLGLRVPPGFIITTEVFRCRELIESYTPANRNFREQVEKEISRLEKLTGSTFGNPGNPLLVSVRSGGVISLPGMMDSYLNVGMNESIVQGIAEKTGNEWFARDCYRRFLQSYGMSFGLKRDEFDSIIAGFKKRYSVPLKRNFSPAQMKEVATAYRDLLFSRGIAVEDSPWEQLYIAIQRVLNSWNSHKAKMYRKIIGISDDWGTSVTVQAMAFGNLSHHSGSGVLFTHSPRFSADLIRPWGDYTIGNQGEDVVSGLVATYPISNYQAQMENRPAEFALENRFPQIFEGLREVARLLVYERQWSPQDIEFTFEGPLRDNLFILQTRDMEMRERKSVPSFESTDEMAQRFIGHGIGVSGGAMTGRVVFTVGDIADWRSREPGTKLILVRGDTVPDDITEISQADGLLTARGGATSHASIVANRLEKTCVVGCTDLVCMEKEKKFILNQEVVQMGDFISIDGSEGSVYLGSMKVRERESA